MQAAIADAVNAVFDHGLSLRDRLDAGEMLQWDIERGTLKQLLAFFDADEGDSPMETELAVLFSGPSETRERDRLARATIRYALTCWLDEWLSHYAPPGSAWRERAPEGKLLGNIEAGTKFCDEARYVETRADLDSLEVMHLCVMLGYRGAWRDKPEQLNAWSARIRQKLAEATHAWAMPACLEPRRETTAPTNDTLLRRMAFSLLLTISLLAPLIAVLRWRF